MITRRTTFRLAPPKSHGASFRAVLSQSWQSQAAILAATGDPTARATAIRRIAEIARTELQIRSREISPCIPSKPRS